MGINPLLSENRLINKLKKLPAVTYMQQKGKTCKKRVKNVQKTCEKRAGKKGVWKKRGAGEKRGAGNNKCPF